MRTLCAWKGFNGAAADRPRTGPTPSTSAATVSRLQWGRGRWAADRLGEADGEPLTDAASMGPRPIGRGQLVRAARHDVRAIASMGPRPIGRGQARALRRSLPVPEGFNG